jgi:hypothetical protein
MMQYGLSCHPYNFSQLQRLFITICTFSDRQMALYVSKLRFLPDRNCF